MQVILIQKMRVEVLKRDALMPISLNNLKKTETLDNVRSVIVLCLRDKVLREVTKEKIVVE